jgi:Fe-Mn family superoxide dismutase
VYPLEILTIAALAAGTFTLPALPYTYESLEPFIDTLTMRLHHDRHFCSFFTTLNTLIPANAVLQGKSLVEINQQVGAPNSIIPAAIATAIR